MSIHLSDVSQSFVDHALDNGWFKDDDMNWKLGFGRDLVGADKFLQFFKKIKSASSHDSTMLFGVYKDTEPAGFIHAKYLGDDSRSVKLFLYFPEGTPAGVAAEAIGEAVKAVFTPDFVQRIEVELLSINKSMIALLRDLGFTQEGIKRSAHWMGVNGFNKVILRKLRAEWRKELSDA